MTWKDIISCLANPVFFEISIGTLDSGKMIMILNFILITPTIMWYLVVVYFLMVMGPKNIETR